MSSAQHRAWPTAAHGESELSLHLFHLHVPSVFSTQSSAGSCPQVAPRSIKKRFCALCCIYLTPKQREQVSIPC